MQLIKPKYIAKLLLLSVMFFSLKSSAGSNYNTHLQKFRTRQHAVAKALSRNQILLVARSYDWKLYGLLENKRKVYHNTIDFSGRVNSSMRRIHDDSPNEYIELNMDFAEDLSRCNVHVPIEQVDSIEVFKKEHYSLFWTKEGGGQRELGGLPINTKWIKIKTNQAIDGKPYLGEKIEHRDSLLRLQAEWYNKTAGENSKMYLPAENPNSFFRHSPAGSYYDKYGNGLEIYSIRTEIKIVFIQKDGSKIVRIIGADKTVGC